MTTRRRLGADFYDRARDWAHQGLLSAFKMLATVRKFLVPGMRLQQVNIAEQQQVNVMPERGSGAE